MKFNINPHLRTPGAVTNGTPDVRGLPGNMQGEIFGYLLDVRHMFFNPATHGLDRIDRTEAGSTSRQW